MLSLNLSSEEAVATLVDISIHSVQQGRMHTASAGDFMIHKEECDIYTKRVPSSTERIPLTRSGFGAESTVEAFSTCRSDSSRLACSAAHDLIPVMIP